MKFHQLFTLFIVLVFLVFPPIFMTQHNEIENQTYSQNFNRFSIFTIVISLIWSIFLFFYTEKKEEKLTRSSLRISLLSFIIIFYISCIFQQVSIFFNINFDNQKIVISSTEKILNSIQIIFLCIYEEVLYRMYLYLSFKKIFSYISNKFFTKNIIFQKKVEELVSTFVVAILFALAHLYSGIIHVIFAFLASLVFSIVYKKTKNIIFPIISHVLYNMLIFLTLTKGGY
jgi:membrane protease YdiL (CAAX protease family)